MDWWGGVRSEPTHEADCYGGNTCVECGGCDCGYIPSTCTDLGCWSIDDHGQWHDESGTSAEECSYG